MSTPQNLPPLPNAAGFDPMYRVDTYVAGQMREYALAAASAVQESLRDTFAAAALAKIIDGNRTTEEIARLAYVLADAMLHARQA